MRNKIMKLLKEIWLAFKESPNLVYEILERWKI
jgi:hypothetical protein